MQYFNLDTNEEENQKLFYKQIYQPFKLNQDYPLRAALFKMPKNGYALSVVIHHIASDGWSQDILKKELLEIYQAKKEKRLPSLKKLNIQFADYAIWQRSNLKETDLANGLSYWEQRLQGYQNVKLPQDFTRPNIQSTKGKIFPLVINQPLKSQIDQLCKQENITLFTLLITTFKVLLYKYSGQTDICIGTPTANREFKELEDLVGMFINTVAIRTDLKHNPSFRQLLQKVKMGVLDDFAHQDIPFEKVVEAIVDDRDMSMNPIYQVMLILTNAPLKIDLEKTNKTVADNQLLNLNLPEEHKKLEYHVARFDLTLQIIESSEELYIKFEYCVDLFKESKIIQLAQHFKNLLEVIVTSPSSLIDDLSILSKAEEHQLLHTFNYRKVDFPTDKTIIDLFNEQVLKHGDDTAVIYQSKKINYRELDYQSNQLAAFLKAKGLIQEELVGVSMERSLNMIVSIMGIIKSGGAYVPIDPNYPLARKQFIVDDTKMRWLLTNRPDEVPTEIGSVEVISLEKNWKEINTYSKEKVGIKIFPKNLVYIIYTSGTSGNPKGVMIEHKGLLNLVLALVEPFNLSKDTKTLQFSSFGFDASCEEVFTSLSLGSTLVIPNPKELLNKKAIGKFILDHKVNKALLPPSYQASVKNELVHLETLVSGGEELNGVLTKELQASGLRVVNAYGPTENTVIITVAEEPIKEDGTKSIGKPLANVEVYILGDQLQLLPIGVEGEIIVGGRQVARGYLNRPELNKEKFIDSPFNLDSNDKLYRTGDLGRWLEDGSIEYLGRKDDQIKIRGYRVELLEIEEALNACDQVSQGAVLVKVDTDNKYLVAYIKPNGELDKKGIQNYLRLNLPNYMVPSIYVEINNLPITTNGKIDKKALAKIDIEDAMHNDYVPPSNEIEKQLVNIWESLFAKEKIGVTDDFYSLGGHSLLATRMVSQIRYELDIEIEIKELFSNLNIEDLAKHIKLIKIKSTQEFESDVFDF